MTLPPDPAPAASVPLPLSARWQELFWALPPGPMRSKLRALENDVSRALMLMSIQPPPASPGVDQLTIYHAGVLGRKQRVYLEVDVNRLLAAERQQHTAQANKAEQQAISLTNTCAEYRRRFGCLSCGEDHPADVMCPPHEVRTTGQAWFRQAVAKARAEVASLTQRLTASIDMFDKHCRALHFQRTTPDNLPALIDAVCETQKRTDQQLTEARQQIGRLNAQASDISIRLSDAGINAMPIPEGVRTLIEQREAAQTQIATLREKATAFLDECENCGGTGVVGLVGKMACCFCAPLRAALAVDPQKP